jgi:hypothetical protein
MDTNPNETRDDGQPATDIVHPEVDAGPAEAGPFLCPRALRPLLRTAVERYRTWPPAWQVVAGVALPIAALAGLVLLLIVLRLVAIALFKILLVAVVLSPIGIVFYLTRRRARQRRDAARAIVQADEVARAETARQRAAYLETIATGKVHPVPDPGTLLLRNSEILWYYCPATVTDSREQSYESTLYVTSLRLVFTAPEYPLEIPVQAINAVQWQADHCWVTGKTANASELFIAEDAELLAAHIRRAALVYNRQMDVGFEPDSDRRIPQDVKAAVWQRDAGRCAQCGATDYLEYDHVIPFSKGGANTCDNLQLLCRRCNLKKGAAI